MRSLRVLPLLVVVPALAACGGSSSDAAVDASVPTASSSANVETDATADTAPSTTDGIVRLDPAAGDEELGDRPAGANPFADVVGCLTEQGLEVTGPDVGGPGDGGPPPDGTMPDGTMPPVGGDDRPQGPGEFEGDPTEFVAQILGLDASDATVSAALDACADTIQLPGAGGGEPPGAPPSTVDA